MFAIEVPLAAGSPEPDSPDLTFRAPADSLAGVRVLVVDNDEAVLVSMKALLEQWGCQPLMARDLESALALCRQQPEPPDLVLADYHLDWGRSGLEVIEALHRRYCHELPAAMITADRSAETLRQFRERGLPVLSKPLRPGKLRALLTHLMAST
ncbi:response regulator [Marinobacterium aestuariivivens]|uniref:Response regulator n=1 Tax=Marinobacterium aestuariivivens TaxID=1698799 RepID=A0ABW2A4B8_9GAMM